MGKLSQYILSVVCTAILCALVQLFFEKDSHIFSTVKLVTGLVLTIAVISPLLNDEMLELDVYFESVSTQSDAVTQKGELAARNSMEAIISQKTQTYILEKADALGADIQVEVALSDALPPVPIAVAVSGSVSPYAKQQLISIIQEELGISEENQTWT